MKAKKYAVTILIIISFLILYEYNNNNENNGFKIIQTQVNIKRYVFEKFTINNSAETGKGLLTLNNFDLLISNDLCNELYVSRYNITTVQIITSYAGNVEARSAIRRAYPKYELEKLGIVRLFMLGQCKPDAKDRITQHALFHENSRYQDLLQGNFYEDYRNLTYKHVMGLKWAGSNCFNLKYVIKMDDDILVDLYDLTALLKKKSLKKYEMAGYVLKNMRPIRLKANKWYVTQEEYNGNTYPAFLSGWMYIMNIQLTLKLVSAAYKVPYFWIDDLLITGILANQLNVTFIDLKDHFTLHSEVVECCIRLKTKCGFFVAPSNGDHSLQIKFHDHCYTCRTFMNACRILPRGKKVEKICVAKRRSTSLGKGLPQLSVLKLG